jgi:hypothetical protein
MARAMAMTMAKGRKIEKGKKRKEKTRKNKKRIWRDVRLEGGDRKGNG